MFSIFLKKFQFFVEHDPNIGDPDDNIPEQWTVKIQAKQNLNNPDLAGPLLTEIYRMCYRTSFNINIWHGQNGLNGFLEPQNEFH